MPLPHIRPARHVLRLLLRLGGFAGITLPWGIYLLREQLGNERLIRHELAHVAQIRRYGVVGFYARYIALWLRHGYRNHPFEIEAREAETRS